MSKELIAKAEEIINAKTGYIGDGMEGYAALALIDENGYPTVTTLTIAKADGIKWLTFCTSPSRNVVKRLEKDNRASVCINSSEYNITLVGTIEVVTDIDFKKENWFPVMDNGEHWKGPEDPEFCVLRFITEHYNLFVDYQEVKGALEGVERKSTPIVEPMLTFDRQCEQAIELYKKAFGANVTMFIRYSDANPTDLKNEAGKITEADMNLVYHAQMMIGKQRVMMCDNLFNDLPRGHSGYLVMQFKTDDEVKTAYDVLSVGAKIINPLSSTTYSSCCASLVDKFGIYWDLMGMEGNFCQSCGMPMGKTDEMYGTESNGCKSKDYCKYCYENGAFTNQQCTLEEMIEIVADIMVKDHGFSQEDAKKQCKEGIPSLKRWKAA